MPRDIRYNATALKGDANKGTGYLCSIQIFLQHTLKIFCCCMRAFIKREAAFKEPYESVCESIHLSSATANLEPGV